MSYIHKASWHFISIILSALLLYSIKYVETSYFPVVKNFTVTKIQVTGVGTLVQGTMEKVRDCTFLQITAYVNDTPVEVQFLDSKAPTTRMTGYQMWGPWNIPSKKTIQIYSRHQCHPLWQQSQKLATIYAIDL